MSKSKPQLSIVNRLRVLRAEKGITQAQLAEAVEVTRATIIAIEGGELQPFPRTGFSHSAFFWG